MKKIYLYYGTEENCFETDKREIKKNEIRPTIKEWLADDYCQVEMQETAASHIEKEFSKNGYGIWECEQGQGYNIIIGVAEQGKCRHLLNRIREARREAIAMF
jgi:ABC-type proline/glycine betaine transport system substrate-binding protein